MISVTLPDGSQRELAEGATARDLAESISGGLLRQAVAAKVDGVITDLSKVLVQGSEVQILTTRDPEALEVLRHSAAHLMADAILQLFPGCQLTIGPVVADGFYYDIYSPEHKITPDDFPAIEKEMAKIAGEKRPFERCVASYDEADQHFSAYQKIDGGDNPFKREIISDIKGRGEELSFYKHGGFIDLCRGPHVPDTGWLKHVKLTKVSGSYWRQDATRQALTRIYGTAFFDKKALAEYLHFLEEAKKRDHRVLGEQLDLFTFYEDAPGFPFFHPKGAQIFNTLAGYMRSELGKHGYREVKTPLVLSEQLWHTSGHYDNYLENMFFTKLKRRDPEAPDQIKDNIIEERAMALKPMNCPGHLMVYKARLHSHQEFPLRFCEMGLVHRRELSGVRHGLFRVQAFTQDDAHHFCTPDQIASEVGFIIEFFHRIYAKFNLGDVRMELSTRPEKSIGSDEIWQTAEAALEKALKDHGADYQLNEGDGAFYGPKIDFHIQDTLKRSWQCGTVQLDFSMPERFGITYVGADGQKHTPVMLHRACYGSLERFMGIIIENYGGAFPTWLAPVQAKVLPVSEKYHDYGRKVFEQLQEAGLRAELNLSNDRVGYKIRQVSLEKIPFGIIVGQKEQDNGTVNVRSRDAGELGEMSVAELLQKCAE